MPLNAFSWTSKSHKCSNGCWPLIASSTPWRLQFRVLFWDNLELLLVWLSFYSNRQGYYRWWLRVDWPFCCRGKFSVNPKPFSQLFWSIQKLRSGFCRWLSTGGHFYWIRESFFRLFRWIWEATLRFDQGRSGCDWKVIGTWIWVLWASLKKSNSKGKFYNYWS